MGVLRWQSLLDRQAGRRIVAEDRAAGWRSSGRVASRRVSIAVSLQSSGARRDLRKCGTGQSGAKAFGGVVRECGSPENRRGRRRRHLRENRQIARLDHAGCRMRLIPRGWWRAGPSTMDSRRRGRSAPMTRRCRPPPFTFTAIDRMTLISPRSISRRSVGSRTRRSRRAARAGSTAIGGATRSCGRRDRNARLSGRPRLDSGRSFATGSVAGQRWRN